MSWYISYSDAGLASQTNRNFNYMGQRAFIVTQSIKKLRTEDKEQALYQDGFKRLSDDKKIKSEAIADDGKKRFHEKEPKESK